MCRKLEMAPDSDLPTRNRTNSNKERSTQNPIDNLPPPEKIKQDDGLENGWRYLAVTAFLVKSFGSRMSVCFIVVSCSDATLTLRALVLLYYHIGFGSFWSAIVEKPTPSNVGPAKQEVEKPATVARSAWEYLEIHVVLVVALDGSQMSLPIEEDEMVQ